MVLIILDTTDEDPDNTPILFDNLQVKEIV